MKAEIDVKNDKIVIVTDNYTFTLTEDGIDIKSKGDVKISGENITLGKPMALDSEPMRNALQRLPPTRKKVLS